MGIELNRFESFQLNETRFMARVIVESCKDTEYFHILKVSASLLANAGDGEPLFTKHFVHPKPVYKPNEEEFKRAVELLAVYGLDLMCKDLSKLRQHLTGEDTTKCIHTGSYEAQLARARLFSKIAD